MALVQNLNDFSAALAQQSAQDDARGAQITDLTDQLGKAQQQVAALQNTITALNLDDETAQAMVASLTPQLAAAKAQVAALQSQLAAAPSALLQKLVNCHTGLHRLPNVADPNARPILQWFQPGNSGNTGGASAATHGLWTITQNADGSTDYAISPVAPFDDYIWGLNFTESAVPLQHAFQVTVFEVADEDLPNLTGIETNFEHSISLTRRNAGIQALLGQDKDAVTGAIVSNQWRYYDISAGHWFYTGIPLDRTMFGTGKRIQLISEFVENPDGSMTNLNLTINGVTHLLNKTTQPKVTTWDPYIQQGWQMDPLKALSMKTKVWDMQTYWI
jgi:hypothetical protein